MAVDEQAEQLDRGDDDAGGTEAAAAALKEKETAVSQMRAEVDKLRGTLSSTIQEAQRASDAKVSDGRRAASATELKDMAAKLVLEARARDEAGRGLGGTTRRLGESV